MRTTGGICIHCSQQVERNEDLVLVTIEQGVPACNDTDLPHQIDEEEDR